MRGLLGNFGPSLMVTAVVTLATLVIVGIVGHRRSSHHELWLPVVARILTLGAILATVSATALPREFGLSGDGDLMLTPGRGGLGDLDQILADPTSLAAVLLYANVMLYVPVAFFATVGFHTQRGRVLPGCLALSVGVEAVQYLALGRVATTDDVILNMAGALLGFGLGSALVAQSSRLRSLIGAGSG